MMSDVNRKKLRTLILDLLESKAPRKLDSCYHWWTGKIHNSQKQICAFTYSENSFTERATVVVALFQRDGAIISAKKIPYESADRIVGGSNDRDGIYPPYNETELIEFINQKFGQCEPAVINIESFLIEDFQEEFKSYAHSVDDFLQDPDSYGDCEVEDLICILAEGWSTLNGCHIDGKGTCVSS